MAFELKEGQGSLWPNDHRNKDTQPNTVGKIMIDGKLRILSGWTKVTKSGTKFISLSSKTADEAAQVDTDTGYPQSDSGPGF